MNPMLPFFIACLLFIAVFTSVEMMSRHINWVTGDVSRKTIHLVSGLMASWLPSILNMAQIRLLGIVFVVLMLISKYANLFPSIHGVRRHTYGEVYFPLAVSLTALLFPAAMYSYAMIVLAISDSAAAIVGGRYGTLVYSVGSNSKSHLGSSVFWLSCLVITLAGMHYLPITGNLAPLPTSLIIATTVTFVEAIANSGFDNLLIPLTAASILTLLT